MDLKKFAQKRIAQRLEPPLDPPEDHNGIEDPECPECGSGMHKIREDSFACPKCGHIAKKDEPDFEPVELGRDEAAEFGGREYP